MIKVLSHGNKISVRNPITGLYQEMIDVRFVEEGRSGGDTNMSNTSKLLSKLIGEETGLPSLRIHTQPVLADKIGQFPIGKVLSAFINRGLYSTPQLRQQVGVPPRMIEGRPTYFKTWLGETVEEDSDHRLSNSELIATNPKAFVDAQIGATDVRVLQLVDTTAESAQNTDVLATSRA